MHDERLWNRNNLKEITKANSMKLLLLSQETLLVQMNHIESINFYLPHRIRTLPPFDPFLFSFEFYISYKT